MRCLSTQPNSAAKGRNDPYRCNISVGNRWFRHVPLQRRRISTCRRLLQLVSHHPTTSCAVVSKLKLIFSEFGIPNFSISDNARQYDSAEFRKFGAEYDFKHETSSPRYPQCNGKAERFVGIVKKTLQKAYEAREDPAIALLCLRTTPIETGLPSPAEMMFDRKIQSNLPTVNIAEKEKACRREQWKRQYNERSHTLKDLNRGQCVRVQDYTTKKWEPAMINQKLSQPRSYMLTTDTCSQY